MFGGKLGKEMMITQGYVPLTCILPDEFAGALIWEYVNKGKDVCTDCNADRSICHGRLKENKDESDPN